MDRRCFSGSALPLRRVALATSAVLLASASGAAVLAAPATYEVQVETRAGMGAGASGMDMMRMMTGGGQPSASRRLDLRLTASQSATAAPQADHVIPAGLGMGSALPLLTPPPPRAGRERVAEDDPEALKGRLVIFRGCAGSPGADTPEVIELAGLMPDQRRMAQAMASRTGKGSREVSQATTTGIWPTSGNERPVPANGSLVGEHRVVSNYAPEIRFQVGAAHDFLAPVQLSARSAGEAMDLTWKAVSTALGSQAMAFGAKESGNEVVIWTSSTARWSESSVPAALDPATARRLIGTGVLMPPEQTRCTISAAAMKRLGVGLVTYTVYGEALQAAGPAPAPGRPPLWTMTLSRTSTSSLPLMDMDGGADAMPAEDPGQEPAPRRGGWGLIPGLF